MTVTKADPSGKNMSDNASVGSLDDVVKYIMSDLSGGGAPAPGGSSGGGMPPQA